MRYNCFSSYGIIPPTGTEVLVLSGQGYKSPNRPGGRPPSHTSTAAKALARVPVAKWDERPE
jgi:hypothetical protein